MPETGNLQSTIIGDSGPLIALTIIGQLDLLHRLYRRVVIPQTVWDEITVKGAGMPGSREVSQANWLEIRHAEAFSLSTLNILVDRGEAEAIALAMALPGSTVLLDDAQARRVAERFGVGRIGTLGILRRAKKAGLIGPIKPYIDRLQTNGIYFRQALIDAVLRDIGE